MKRVPIRSTLVAVVMLSMLVVSVTVSAQAPPASQAAGSVRWLTYVDPRFDFSIRYPSDWVVIPRDDSDPTAVSGMVVFVPTTAPDSDGKTSGDPHDPGPYITVGPYLAELEEGQSLSEWTEMYESLGRESDRIGIQRQPRRISRVHGASALHEEGVSSLTTYQFTNLVHKNMVWLIWTNIPSTDSDAIAYNRMVRSFRFGRNSPANLREAYGSDFVPMDMEEVLSMSRENDARNSQDKTGNDRPMSFEAEIANLTSTWYSPVRSGQTGPWNVTCGSPYHTGSSDFAADIGVPRNTPVYNAKTGFVTFRGQKTNGYGNLVTIKANGGKEAYYAHLQSINSAVQTGYQFPTFDIVGFSGNTTGNSTSIPYHLHFHVTWGNAPEDLRGMVGFTANENYPGNDNGTSVVCGTMGR